MSQALLNAERARRRVERPERQALPLQERKALSHLRVEAKAAGAPLTTNGKGGLPPSLVLGVMRRDQYTCKRCGTRGENSGGLGVHHKGGLDNPVSAWLAGKAKRNDFNNLVTICRNCHDGVHDEDRAREPPPQE